MSQPPKPCFHCAGTTMHVIPNVQVDIKIAETFLGMQAKRDLRVDWGVTLVVCSHCGFTQAFTTNAAQLAQLFPGSTTMAAQPR